MFTRALASILLICAAVSPAAVAATDAQPGQAIIARACGLNYFSHMRATISQMFANDDAANFQASLGSAREIITAAEECSDKLPTCADDASDCHAAQININGAILLGEQYNARALAGSGQSRNLASALDAELQQTLYLCRLPGINNGGQPYQSARDTLTLVLNSAAKLRQSYSSSPVDEHLIALQQCTSHIGADVTW